MDQVYDELLQNKGHLSSSDNSNSQNSMGFDQSQKVYQPESRNSNNQFGFGSWVGRAFLQDNQLGAGAFQSSNQKQLFTNVEVNLLVPKDPSNVTSSFNLNQWIEDHMDKLERIQYFCEIPNFCNGETLLMKSIDYFNQQLHEKGSPLKLSTDIQHFQMRIAKKKNGKPNSDYPKIDLTQIVADIDFSIFCIVYNSQSITNALTLSTLSRPSQTKGKGIRTTKGKNSHDMSTQKDSVLTSGYESLMLSKRQESSKNLSSIPSYSQMETVQTDAGYIHQHTKSTMSAHSKNTQHQACCNNGCHIF
ncbi:UNKNOWN [Stylonychia lemnae]|uniref:Uncharacterized protein n=1 Tax=Stylonychia lemnae TaxID=5949 RepID=A0A078B0R0_STYLE|nr:UNKNOWN [Stylonychia lemnae]|eukprot:CDW87871.1 UNKNOWN [Stylonychia lemnae]